jgi:hypothetical protein
LCLVIIYIIPAGTYGSQIYGTGLLQTGKQGVLYLAVVETSIAIYEGTLARKQKATINQLQDVNMALEDAKLFRKDIYALIVDFISALTPLTMTLCFRSCIMYDLGFSTDVFADDLLCPTGNLHNLKYKLVNSHSILTGPDYFRQQNQGHR